MPELSSYPRKTSLDGTERIPIVTNPGVAGGNGYITADDLTTDVLANINTATLAADPAFTSRYASVFNVMAYGAVGDGVANDSPAVQAAINAAALVGGGVILWPAGCLTRIGTCVNFPATGQFVLRSDRPAPSVYAANAADKVSGIYCAATVAGQPAAFGNSARYNFLFYVPPSAAAPGRRLTLVFENMLVYNTAGAGKVGLVGVFNNYLSLFKVSDSYIHALEIGYFSVTGEQIDRFTVERNHLTGGGVWFEGSAPELGIITGNNVDLPGDAANPKTKAQFLQVVEFWSFFVSHNYFEVDGTVASRSAVIWYDGIIETQDGSIHDNLFYGAGDGCIYVQTSNIDTNVNATGGLRIHDNMFTNWGLHNVAGGLRTAITVDAPGVANANADVHIGSNSYFGSAHSDYGIVLVGDPVAQGITVSRDQFMKFIAVAPLKSNGVTYGGPGAVRELSFYAPVLPVPATVKRSRFRSGQPYGPAPFASETAVTLGNGICAVAPFYVDSAITMTTIGIEVMAAGGTNLRLGIWRDDGTGAPVALVLDAGTVGAASPGWTSIAISQLLTPDLYWLGVVAQGSDCQVRGLLGHLEPLMLGGSAGSYNGYSMNGVSGAFAPFRIDNPTVGAPKVLLIAA